MNFSSLIRNTFENAKKASVKFWIICLVAAVLGGVSQTSKDILQYAESQSSTQNEIASTDYDTITGNFDNLTEEEYNALLQTYDDLDLDLDLDSILSSAGLEKSDVIKFTCVAATILFFLGLISLVVSTIYKYLLYNSALESIEGENYVSRNNLVSSIGAQILSGFSIVASVSVSMLCLLLTFIVHPLFIIVFLGILLILTPYLVIRLSGVNYVYSKYKDLSATKIINKSFELTKGRVLRILAYNVLIQIIIAVCLSPFGFLVSILSNIGFITLVILSFVYNVLSALLICAFMVMFNITLFKELDFLNEINSNLVVDNLQNLDMNK